jgi:hypothetical protein
MNDEHNGGMTKEPGSHKGMDVLDARTSVDTFMQRAMDMVAETGSAVLAFSQNIDVEQLPSSTEA